MENKKTMGFEIATPERVVLKKEVKQVTVPTTEGEITVLPKHSPLIAVLKPGVIEAKLEDDSMEIMSVAGGFVNILKNKLVILADSAQKGEELDDQAVEEAKKRAQEYKDKASSQDQVEYTEIAVKLERELAKLRAANKWRRLNNISKN